MKKDIRHGSGGFVRMLVNYTGATVTLSRLGNMFNKGDTVHPSRVSLGE
jgi:hypothetical protein